MEDCIWKRDPNIPNGTTWSQFQRSTREDKILHFRIQDLTEQFENECIKYMIKYFAREEQFTKSLKIADDEDSAKELQSFWYHVLKSNLSLVCLVDESGDFKKPKVAGINILKSCNYLNLDLDVTVQTEKCKDAKKISDYIHEKADFSVLPKSEVLTAYGLVVLPEYRGMGIGLELIKAREPLAKAVGLKSAVTLFTSTTSQKIGETTGYITLAEVPYEDLSEKFPKYTFHGGKNKSVKITYKIFY